MSGSVAMAGMVHQFGLGSWTLGMSYLVSVAGSFVGLTCAVIARHSGPRARTRWLLLAALAIGGVGIWLMHFLAMFGWSVSGSATRLDPALTVLSALLSVVGTFVALLIVGRRLSWPRLVAGGVVLGASAAGMHYVGAAAIKVQGTISYDLPLVIVSVVIAMTAATVALWFTLVLASTLMRWIGALIMGVAVVAMHFTGMYAMHVKLNAARGIPSGFDQFTVLFPVFVAGMLLLGLPIVAILLRPSEPDTATDAAGEARSGAHARGRAAEDLAAYAPN